ncbi:MAG: autotransporter outer membrane beta-barrel domain-containing protein, partial [Proteobacteria bacterium]
MKLVLTALLLTLLSLASLKDAQAEGYVSLGGHRLMSRISFEESAYTLNWVFREKRLKYGWTLLGIETSKFTRTYGKTTDVTDYTGGAYSSYRFNKSLYLDSGVQFSTGKFLPQYRVTFLPTFVHD